MLLHARCFGLLIWTCVKANMRGYKQWQVINWTCSWLQRYSLHVKPCASFMRNWVCRCMGCGSEHSPDQGISRVQRNVDCGTDNLPVRFGESKCSRRPPQKKTDAWCNVPRLADVLNSRFTLCPTMEEVCLGLSLTMHLRDIRQGNWVMYPGMW